MDNIRDSLSGIKHDVKHLRELKRDITHLLERNKRKADKTWPDGPGERSYSPRPSARPESQTVTDGDREGGGNQSNMEVGSPGPSVAPDENVSNWKSTVSASAKLLLRGVRDSADALGPLKSIAGGLCFILENYEVRLPPSYPILNAYRSHSVRRGINGRSNRWHPGSKRLPSGSASPFLWAIARREKGGADSSSKSALQGYNATSDPREWAGNCTSSAGIYSHWKNKERSRGSSKTSRILASLTVLSRISAMRWWNTRYASTTQPNQALLTPALDLDTAGHL